jgi:hypothetical protein
VSITVGSLASLRDPANLGAAATRAFRPYETQRLLGVIAGPEWTELVFDGGPGMANLFSFRVRDDGQFEYARGATDDPAGYVGRCREL